MHWPTTLLRWVVLAITVTLCLPFVSIFPFPVLRSNSITEANDADFSAGTFNQTTLVGSGVDAEVRLSKTAESLKEEAIESPYDRHFHKTFGEGEEGGQTFKPSRSFFVTKVAFWLDIYWVRLRYRIYTHTGTWGVNGFPTGGALALSEEYDGWVSYACDWATASFPTPYPVQSDTPYCLTVRLERGNNINIHKSHSNAHPGNHFTIREGPANPDNDVFMRIYGNEYHSSGTFISRKINTGEPTRFVRISWSGTTPNGTDIELQIRTAETEAALDSAAWHGPTSASDYYTNPGQDINPVHDGDRWVQYRAVLSTTDPINTPELEAVTIEYEVAVEIHTVAPSADYANVGSQVVVSGQVYYCDTKVAPPSVGVYSNGTHVADTKTDGSFRFPLTLPSEEGDYTYVISVDRGVETKSFGIRGDSLAIMDTSIVDTHVSVGTEVAFSGGVNYTLGSEEVKGEPWLAGWDYRKPVKITGLSGSVLTDYQVCLTLDTRSLVEVGKMRSDGGDMRFASSNAMIIPYWIESGANTTETKVWIKVPSIPASGSSTVYFYYGNLGVGDASSFDATFTKDFVETGLVGLWHMDTGSGTSIPDSSGNALHGTSYNGSVVLPLDRWLYRVPITVTELSGQTLTNFQVLVTVDTASLIGAGKMEPDCADARFTNSDGETLIPFWIESGAGTVETRFWVKVPLIPASGSTTIYLYYGHSGASGTSDFDNTFTKDFGDKGLVGLWHMDEGGGTSVHDSSGNALHGELHRLEGSMTDTTDADFNAGSFTNTERYGTGSGAGVRLTRTAESLKYQRALTCHKTLGRCGTWDEGFTAPSSFFLTSGGYYATGYWARVRYYLLNRGGGTLATSELYDCWVSCGGTGPAAFPSHYPIQQGAYYYLRIHLEQGNNVNLFREWGHSFAVYGNEYHPSGAFISRKYDTGAGSNYGRISWSGTTPNGTDIELQIRTADSEVGLDSATWYGPTGTRDYYTSPSQGINPIHNGHRWIQYKAVISTSVGTSTPELEGVTVTYFVLPDQWVGSDGGRWDGRIDVRFSTGDCLTFDGTDDHVDFGDPADGSLDFAAGQDFSVVLWVKTSSTGGMVLAKGGDGDDAKGYWLYLSEAGKFEAGLTDGVGSRRLGASASSINDGSWHHLAAVFDRDDKCTIYIDGSADGTPFDITSEGDLSNTNPLTVARRSDGDAQYFRGVIDEVRIYNRILFADEILCQYQRRKRASTEPSKSAGTEVASRRPASLWVGSDGGRWDGRIDVRFSTGDCLTFDGTDDNVEVADDPSLDITGDITIEAWIYPENFWAGDVGSVVEKDGAYGLRISSAGDLILSLHGVTGTEFFSNSGVLSPGTWQHVAVTRARSTGDIDWYVNGTNVGGSLGGTESINTSDDALFIGGNADSSKAFNGRIDEVRIYNRILSAGEIRCHYERRKYATTEPSTEFGPEEESTEGIGEQTNAVKVRIDGEDYTLLNTNCRGRWSWSVSYDKVCRHTIEFVPINSPHGITAAANSSSWTITWDALDIVNGAASGTELLKGETVSLSGDLVYAYDNRSVAGHPGAITVYIDSEYVALIDTDEEGHWNYERSYDFCGVHTFRFVGASSPDEITAPRTEYTVTIEWLGNLVIVSTSSPNTRVDIGTTVSFSGYVKYEHNDELIGAQVGAVRVKLDGVEFAYLDTDSLGAWSWSVSYPDVCGHTFEFDPVNSPLGLTDAYGTLSWTIIWDRVEMMLTVSDGRINVGDMAPLSGTGKYAYDGTEFMGTYTLNDSVINHLEVGRHGYKVASITDANYGLTAFTTNEVYVIWDKLTVSLSASDDRINVGDAAAISYTATYQYDGLSAAPHLTITLSNSLTQNTVGTYNYAVQSAFETQYGLTAFDSETVAVIFDRIEVYDGGAEPVLRIPVGNEGTFWWKLRYEYDGVTLTDGSITLTSGGELTYTDGRWQLSETHNEVGAVSYAIGSASGNRYGITVLNDRVGTITISWETVGIDVDLPSIPPDVSYVTSDTESEHYDPRYADLIAGQGLVGYLPYELIDLHLNLKYQSDGSQVSNAMIHVTLEADRDYYEYDVMTDSSGAFRTKVVVPYNASDPVGAGTWTMRLSDPNGVVGLMSIIAPRYEYLFSVENGYESATVNVTLAWQDDGEPVINKHGKLQAVVEGQPIDAYIGDEGWVQFEIPFTFDLEGSVHFTFSHVGIHKCLEPSGIEILRPKLVDLHVYGNEVEMSVRGGITLDGLPVAGLCRLETATGSVDTKSPAPSFDLMIEGNEEVILSVKASNERAKIVNTIDCKRVIHDPIRADVYVESYQREADVWTITVVSRTKFITMRNVVVRVEGNSYPIGDLGAGDSARLNFSSSSVNPFVTVTASDMPVTRKGLSKS